MLFFRVAVAIGAQSSAGSLHLGSSSVSDPLDVSDIVFALNSNLPSLDSNDATSVEKLDRKFVASLFARCNASTALDSNEQPPPAIIGGAAASSSSTLYQGPGPFSARLVRAKSLASIPNHSRDASLLSAVFSMELLQRLCQSYSSGLLEVQALHFSLHSATEGVSLVDLNPLSNGAQATGTRSAGGSAGASAVAKSAASASSSSALNAVEFPVWSSLQMSSDWTSAASLEDLLVYNPLASTQPTATLDSINPLGSLFPLESELPKVTSASSMSFAEHQAAFLSSGSFADATGSNAGAAGSGTGAATPPSAASLTLIEKLKTIKAATSKTSHAGAGAPGPSTASVGQQQQLLVPQNTQTSTASLSSPPASAAAAAASSAAALPTIITHSASELFAAPNASAPTLGATPLPGNLMSTVLAVLLYRLYCTQVQYILLIGTHLSVTCSHMFLLMTSNNLPYIHVFPASLRVQVDPLSTVFANFSCA